MNKTMTELTRPEVLALEEDNALAEACEQAQEACMLLFKTPEC